MKVKLGALSAVVVVVARAGITLMNWSRGKPVLLAGGRHARLPVWLETERGVQGGKELQRGSLRSIHTLISNPR